MVDILWCTELIGCVIITKLKAILSLGNRAIEINSFYSKATPSHGLDYETNEMFQPLPMFCNCKLAYQKFLGGLQKAVSFKWWCWCWPQPSAIFWAIIGTSGRREVIKPQLQYTENKHHWLTGFGMRAEEIRSFLLTLDYLVNLNAWFHSLRNA